MGIAHLDISYPSLEAFQNDCVECQCDAEHLLNSGVYSLMVYGFVVSKYHDSFRTEDMLPMDVRPTAWESRLNIWQAMEEDGSTTEYQTAVIDLICDLPYHGRVPGYELDPSDILGMYLMGEEL